MYELYFKKDLYKAKAYVDTAFTFAEIEKNDSLKSQVTKAYGNINFLQGNYKLALKYFLDYLQSQENSNNKKGIADAYGSIGNVNYLQNNLDEAEKHYLISIALYNEREKETNTNNNNKYRIVNNLANIYDVKNENIKALETYKTSYVSFSRTKDYINLGNVCNNMGNIFLEIGVPDSALLYLNKGLEARKLNYDVRGQAKSYKSIGKFYIQLKNISEAIKNLELALELAEKSGELPTMLEVNMLLDNAYQKTNNYKKAHEALQKSGTIKDKMFNERLTRELTQLEMQSEFDKKEKQYQLEQKIKEFRFIITISVLSLLVIIIGLLYFLARGKNKQNLLKKNNLKLEKQNLELEKKNLQKELETKNKELTTNVMYLLKKNEFLNSVSSKLLDLKNNLKLENQQPIQKIVFDIQKSMDTEIWKEFELRFQMVHSQFYKSLNKKFPDLSANEKKLCAFLRLNMSTKDIAALLHRNENSISVARTRLRKKLNLTNLDVDLVNFLAKL